jgi:spore coat protein A
MAKHLACRPDRKRNRTVLRLEPLEDRSLLNAAVPAVTLDPSTVPQFVNPLPDPLDPSFVYAPSGTTKVTLEDGTTQTAPLYKIGVYQIQEDLGLGLTDANGKPIKTTVWGYGTSQATATYPGGTFVVNGDPNGINNQPIAVHWTNNLVDKEGDPLPDILPVDPTVLDTSDKNGKSYYTVTDGQVAFTTGVPIVPHLHGGHTQAAFEGTPQQWFTPGGQVRASAH